jgi:hypothetical protein
MALEYPHTFQDGVGQVASGAQVMDNFNAAKAAIESLQSAVTGLLAESLTASGHSYGAYTARTLNTEYEPSASRATLVVVELSWGGGNPRVPLAFIVPPGQKWKITEASETATVTVGGQAVNISSPPNGTGAVHQLFSTYLTL